MRVADSCGAASRSIAWLLQPDAPAPRAMGWHRCSMLAGTPAASCDRRGRAMRWLPCATQLSPSPGWPVPCSVGGAALLRRLMSARARAPRPESACTGGLGYGGEPGQLWRRAPAPGPGVPTRLDVRLPHQDALPMLLWIALAITRKGRPYGIARAPWVARGDHPTVRRRRVRRWGFPRRRAVARMQGRPVRRAAEPWPDIQDFWTRSYRIRTPCPMLPHTNLSPYAPPRERQSAPGRVE